MIYESREVACQTELAFFIEQDAYNQGYMYIRLVDLKFQLVLVKPKDIDAPFFAPHSHYRVLRVFMSDDTELL